MNPRLLASTNCDCCVETVAPSELRMTGAAANAASSQRLASAIASSVSSAHGWKRSSSGASLARRSGSGRPERRGDRLLERRAREIRRARVAAPRLRALAEIDGDADAAVAVVLDRIGL